MKTLIARWMAVPFLLVLTAATAWPQTLEETFENPPEQSRPWCYWYWISDNISKEGITKDLEAMADVGIGAALIGNQWFQDQPMGDIHVLSEEWWDLTVHAVREGKRVGVDIGLFNCPGWSQSGGPWVQPSQSMRYLASSEVVVNGPGKFSGQLPAPGDNFQDVALIAMPAPVGDAYSNAALKPSVECDPPIGKAETLVDGDPATAAPIPSGPKNNGPVTIDIAFEKPLTARSVVFTPGPGNFRTEIDILALIDGEYKQVRRVKYDRRNPAIAVGPMPNGPVIASLPATTSDRFRLVLSPRTGSGQLAEIEVSPAARLELAIEKQLGKVHPTPTPLWGDYLWPVTPEPEDESLVVKTNDVIDLSGKLDADGTLTWNVPEGAWIIQRVGMLPTGTENSPAAPYARGPEVDKMNGEHLASHFDAYVGELLRRLTPEEKKAFKYVVADSYEMGPQNWTDGMRESFEEVYGYDPLPFLPVLSGRIVESADLSDRFLWDLRRLVADRVAEQYVGALRDLCGENDLQMWLENYGHWGFPGEFMRYGGECDLIAGEFWVTGTLGNIECRAAASTAHAYGKPICYAEAFTSGDNWAYTPYDLKARGDWAFTEGINHFVLHLYIQQPSDDFVPGMNAWFGTEFNRHNTWFFEGKDWFDYLRRCHVLLQQGSHVGDFAYFIGEDAPIMTGTRQPEQPAGYDFDFINAEVLLDRIDVRDGRWTLPEGKSYRVLVLPPLDTMRPAVMERLAELFAKGGVLYGPAPLRSPSGQAMSASDAKVAEAAKKLWGGLQSGDIGQNKLGRGIVFQGGGLQRVTDALGMTPDVSNIDATCLWTHRQTPDMDVYFLSNQKHETVDLAPIFRVKGDRVPQLWSAETGRIETTGVYQAVAGGVRVPLRLGPAESVFVVFREQTTAPSAPIANIAGPSPVHVAAGQDAWLGDFTTGGEYVLHNAEGDRAVFTVDAPPAPINVAGPWTLQFTPGRDAPERLELDALKLWTDLDDEAVRHYSGSATYRATFTMPADRLDDKSLRYVLDLPGAKPMARVILNGKDLGLQWRPPFAIDVTDAIKPGENVLEIRVTNLWSNRLVGEMKFPDGFPGREGGNEFKASNSVQGKLREDRPLQPSGLEGPVEIQCVRRVALPTGK